MGEGCGVRVGHFDLRKNSPSVGEADTLDLRDVDSQSIKVDSSSEVYFETINSSLSIHREEILTNGDVKTRIYMWIIFPSIQRKMPSVLQMLSDVR